MPGMKEWVGVADCFAGGGYEQVSRFVVDGAEKTMSCGGREVESAKRSGTGERAPVRNAGCRRLHR
jgi:hypothetical protein